MAIARRRELADQRTDVQLIGTPNAALKVFTTPDVFFHDPSRSIRLYLNGQRLFQGVDGVGDYVAGESGGIGTGYDSVIINASCLAPKPGDLLTADYFIV